MFGSLKCRTSDRLLEVNVSGFSDALRKEIQDNIEEWTATVSVPQSSRLSPTRSAAVAE